jgi:predicted O-methyltransferase YrrM
VRADGADVQAAKAIIGSRPVDFVFIDGDHLRSYDDWLAWRPHLSAGAIVCFHDAYFSPVRATLAATGLRFVNFGGWGHLAVGRMPGRIA